MKFTPTPLPGSFEIQPQVFEDGRGTFYRYYDRDEFAAIGFDGEWVQLNHSYTTTRGTIRGMHYQRPPHGEIKLVKCIAGGVLDVIVDIRQGSATFLQSYAIELSADNRKMLYIPAGFAHGFQALENNSELIYHHSTVYSPAAEAGLKFDDPVLDIRWPLPAVLVSERDRSHAVIDTNFKGI
ncbi:MAG TPA: dTDP-4-dehydrorhamnose 3,5-epimerase [Chitinophagaceae bacterium]